MTRSPRALLLNGGRVLAAAAAASLCLAFAASAAPAPPAPPADAPTDLSALSIEELANVDISSVSKIDQPLSEAPAAIYVITREEILRSGATRLAEILRLAPNLQVAQVTASSFAISARGFNGTAAAKLLVLVDGRSIYSSFFSGVFWDVHDVPPQTIDRIEVISGPGATLWGANAVNGVINIVTRSSADPPGAVVEANAGGRERRVAAHVSGRLSDSLSLRLYLESASHDDDVTAVGRDARDAWRQAQGGFRLDWNASNDLVTVQGDIYGGAQRQTLGPDQRVSGHNLLARWTRELEGGSTLRVQAYYDDLERTKAGFFGDDVHTYDVELQHSFTLGRHAVVWGGGYRRTKDRFPIVPGNPSTPLTQFFQPESRALHLANAFVQDTVTLSPALRLTLGVKVEDDPYVDAELLPSARLSWQASDTTLLWAAVSRAVRAPSRLDRDFFQTSGRLIILAPGRFQPESLIAYELGYRGRPTPRTSLSISAFYNVYDDLRTFEAPAGRSFPVTIANAMEGETWGVEAWGSFQAADWWRLSAGGNWLREDLRFKPGARGLGGLQSAGNDPEHQLSLRSAMTLPHGLAFDLHLRRVGSLPAPASPAYTELNGRLAWAVTEAVELSLAGFNLLHAHHPEFGVARSSVQLGASGVETARSVVLAARWRF